jgi:putative exosortase-associated protein (TIGR04073 family)
MGKTRTRHALAAVVMTAGLLASAVPAHAANELTGYDPGDKLVRGLANTFLGLLEVPKKIHSETQADNSILRGWTIGLGKGLGYAVLRTGVGLYEIVTFPFAAPEGYRPIVKPDYPWQASGPDVVN